MTHYVIIDNDDVLGPFDSRDEAEAAGDEWSTDNGPHSYVTIVESVVKYDLS